MEARPGRTDADHLPPTNEVEVIVEAATAFGDTARARLDAAADELAAWISTGPVALWGAGTKGMTYLNLVEGAEQVAAVVDINQRKRGFGVPGTALAIAEPDALTALQPETVLIANPIYRDEIPGQSLKAWCRGQRSPTVVVTTEPESIWLRRATDEDLATIVEVCGEALAWTDLPTDRAFFRWKHVDNWLGPSPIWVAEAKQQADDPAPRIVGVRTMMRWALTDPNGVTHQMVRAVDTATLPSYQGRGIFSKLTVGAVEALTDDGVAAVFNTPNDKSRPGYLKMGWHEVGRVPFAAQPKSLGAVLAMRRSNVPAEKWGLPTEVGLEPAVVFNDTSAIEAAIAGSPSVKGWHTPMSVDYLRWRTAFGPLAARVMPIGHSIDDGLLVFRLRRRGEVRQLSILHAIGPAGQGDRRRAVRQLLRDTGADVVMAAGERLGLVEGLVPVRRLGPRLTWRPLAHPTSPDRAALRLELGAIELF